jgi:phosphonate transport system substrate-binding protein
VPTIIPSDTPTPRSTPLPELTPTPQVGSEDNPLTLVLVRPEGIGAAAGRSAGGEIAQALSDASGLTVTVEVVETQSDAVLYLCQAGLSSPAAALLDAWGYAQLAGLNCASPALLLAQGGSVVQDIDVFTTRSAGAGRVRDLQASTFCRLSFTDVETWLVPALILRANGVNPTSSLSFVRDTDDYGELIAAVASGDCRGGAMPAADLEEEATSAQARQISVIEDARLSIPYGVMVFTSSVPLGEREALADALDEARADAEDAFADLIGGTGFERASVTALEQYDALLERAGVPLVAAGT